MKRKIILPILLLLALAAGYYFLRLRPAGPAEEVEILRQATIERGRLSATVSATGSIEPEAQVSLSFAAPGTVASVAAVRGARVQAGDVLAELEAGELALSVRQAEDALRIQQLTLEQARHSAASPAELAIAQADMDAAAGNLTIADANLAAAEASLSQAQAERSRLLAGPTPGQIAAAESQLASAAAQQRQAQIAYNRTLECFDVTLPNGETEQSCPLLGPAEEQARAVLASADAAVAAAQAQLADLQAGPTPADVQAANAAVAAALAQTASAAGSVQV
ncbi:MAG: biotin/lipoyl-binding protein, partial [Candidatus Promineifilaceae bacterium]